MKRTLLVLTAALAAVWGLECVHVQRLRHELDARRRDAAELSSLRHQQQELKAQQVTEEELIALRKAVQASAIVRPETAPIKGSSPTVRAIEIGEWASAQTWKNAGQATPEATLETALYAAAGGDVTLFSGLLELPDALRQEIDSARASMPQESRTLFPTAESLVAALALKSIPVGDAQVIWSQRTSEHAATLGVSLRNPPTPAGSTDLSTPTPPIGPKDQPPPELPRSYGTKALALTLHESGEGWRLVVPNDVLSRLRDVGLHPQEERAPGNP